MSQQGQDTAILSESIETILMERRSVRSFLDKPVPQSLLERVFTLAQRSPSNCNTQPWAVHVASGETLAALREALPKQAMSGNTHLDFPYNIKYPGVFQERQYDAANKLYASLDIKREDKARRQDVFMDNYRFFGAPHAVFLFLPEHFGLREAADVGMYAQSLMLTLTAHGLGSCPQTSLGFHADIIKEMLGIGEELKLLFGLSFGYPDLDSPINTVRVDRAELTDVAVFHQ
ncbi:nitroreductase [Gammaproteobacteria bacterium 45_16_T64]|nr:nitroreductase [Gammaproteobacteria bacterium 45_16_T64]